VAAQGDGYACGVIAGARYCTLGCCLRTMCVSTVGVDARFMLVTESVRGQTWTSRPAVKALSPAAVMKIARIVGDSERRFTIFARFTHILYRHVRKAV
jgi:hypothetical protein